MEKLYRVVVTVSHSAREDWETSIYVWAYKAEKKPKIVVLNRIREGKVGTGYGAVTRLKHEEIDAPWVNAYNGSVSAGVYCTEEQIEDYIGLLKEKVMSKLNEIIAFWEFGKVIFLHGRDNIEVQYMENR